MNPMSEILILSYKLKDDKFLRFAMFLSFKELFISPQPYVRLRFGLDQNAVVLMDK